MYEFIEGNIIELTPAYIIIQTGGIGYFIHISVNTYTQYSNTIKPDINILHKIFVHQVVREDSVSLFGFFSIRERELFRLLITVSGIGANTARMILSSLTTDELSRSISEGNVIVLKSVKGIGLKTAQRMIIDLKDKINTEPLLNDKLSFQNNRIREEALSALVTLGFAKSTVEKLIDKFLAATPDLTVEDLIKQILKSL
jgi:Holliday junction DNA helicase RuvA